jgi:tellurite resistance protein TerC
MSTLNVPFWVWAGTIGALVLIIGLELWVGARKGAHRPGLRESALWTAAAVLSAVLFGLGLAWVGGEPAAARQFFAGWLTEYSLSLDNLFIFVLLIGHSAVPEKHHSRILLLGVVLALTFRGIFIAVGASALSRFSWLLYVFGALLIYTAARLVLSHREPGAAPEPPRDGLLLRAVRRIVPVSDQSDGTRLITRVDGRRMATPVLFLIIVIAATDLAFALDSIPAIFGLTREPYLIFTANMFALLGLRHLYFLIGGLLNRLVHLSAGLAVILGFIGFKLIAEALLESGIHHVGPVPVPHISTDLSLAVIGAVLLVVTTTSVLAGRRARRPADQARLQGDQARPQGDQARPPEEQLPGAPPAEADRPTARPHSGTSPGGATSSALVTVDDE